MLLSSVMCGAQLCVTLLHAWQGSGFVYTSVNTNTGAVCHFLPRPPIGCQATSLGDRNFSASLCSYGIWYMWSNINQNTVMWGTTESRRMASWEGRWKATTLQVSVGECRLFSTAADKGGWFPHSDERATGCLSGPPSFSEGTPYLLFPGWKHSRENSPF